MTPATYTVTRAKNAGEKDNPNGGKLVKWYVGLKNETDEWGDVYWQRKPDSEVNVGDEVFGELSKGEYGWRFKTASQGGGRGNPAKDAYWDRKEQRDIEAIPRMGRAHAQEMALRVIALDPESAQQRLRGAAGGLEPLLTHWTDWFQADVDAMNGADVGGTPEGGSPGAGGGVGNPAALNQGVRSGSNGSPTETESSRETAADVSAELASSKQKGAITRRCNELAVGSDFKPLLLEWAGGEPFTKAKASDLIAVLKEAKDFADVWRLTDLPNPLAGKEEVPPDMSDLPEDVQDAVDDGTLILEEAS